MAAQLLATQPELRRLWQAHITDNATLISVGIASRVLHADAMGRLWSTLPGLGPLVKCLPSAVQQKASDTKQAVVSRATLLAEESATVARVN